jgi:hypothetical protein
MTVIVLEFDEKSPLQEENRNREAFMVTFDGLAAETVTVALGSYHPLGVVTPPFGLTERRY